MSEDRDMFGGDDLSPIRSSGNDHIYFITRAEMSQFRKEVNGKFDHIIGKIDKLNDLKVDIGVIKTSLQATKEKKTNMFNKLSLVIISIVSVVSAAIGAVTAKLLG